MILYDYPRSSAAYRVRIALNLKHLDYQRREISLINGEQLSPDFVALNANRSVPILETEHGRITQSMAIIEYLDAYYPTPALLPADPVEQAHCRALAQIIASDIHPLNNLRILNYLTEELAITPTQKTQWYHHWIHRGFTAIETELASTKGQFCFGDHPSLADLCLIPQLYNARRFECDLSDYPLITNIERHCFTLEAFQNAHPDKDIS